MGSEPVVCVGVPVWRGSDFVAETLESILRQQDAQFRVFISVDGPDIASERACQPFLSDPRVKLRVHPQRQGWIRNSEAVLAEAVASGADYGCVQPQDDLLEDGYLATLMQAAEAAPQAAVVFSDVQMFGDRFFTAGQNSVTGPPLERQIVLLRRHFYAVAWRGLARTSALSRIGPSTARVSIDFGADMVWVARMAAVGELIRVPQVLYRKRLHGGNTHAEWLSGSRDQKVQAWARHCAAMLFETLRVAKNPGEQELLFEAATERLLERAAVIGPYRELNRPTAADRVKLVAAFTSSLHQMFAGMSQTASL